MSLRGHHLCGGTCASAYNCLPLLPVCFLRAPEAHFQALPSDNGCPQPGGALTSWTHPTTSLAHRSMTLKHKLENVTVDGKRDWRREDRSSGGGAAPLRFPLTSGITLAGSLSFTSIVTSPAESQGPPPGVQICIFTRPSRGAVPSRQVRSLKYGVHRGHYLREVKTVPGEHQAEPALGSTVFPSLTC